MGRGALLWQTSENGDDPAEFLDEAVPVLDVELGAASAAWREAAASWRAVAEIALPVDVPEFARIRDLTAAVQQSITADGDGGRQDAARDAAALWTLRADLDDEPPLSREQRADLFAALGTVHAAERAAVAELAAVPA